MSTTAIRLPSRKWSMIASGAACMCVVVLSYIFAVSMALVCLALPFVLSQVMPINNESLWFVTGLLFSVYLLLSLFGLVAGFKILWSLVPRMSPFEINGVLIDLTKEKRLATHIKEIAGALNVSMPSEVYLTGDATAVATQLGGFMGLGSRRILRLGLPLFQMLTISQFRAVLAHEFAHFYAGDTRRWLDFTQRAIARVYENLGQKSGVCSFLSRNSVVAGPYIMLMGAIQVYWKIFIRLVRLICSQEEYRSDELACHVAGSQSLIEGLQNVRKCDALMHFYWTSIVLPVATGGFQPPVAEGFRRFMKVPQIARAASDFLAEQIRDPRTDPSDTHLPLIKRIEQARFHSLPTPTIFNHASAHVLPMISLINELGPLEINLLRKLLPDLADTELRPMNWDTAGKEVYVPMWRSQIANFVPILSTKTLSALHGLVIKPKAISDRVLNPPRMRLNRAQRDAKALEILSCALSLSLLDHGWKLFVQPGIVSLRCNNTSLEPVSLIAAMKSGRVSTKQWEDYCSKAEISDWLLVPSAMSSLKRLVKLRLNG